MALSQLKKREREECLYPKPSSVTHKLCDPGQVAQFLCVFSVLLGKMGVIIGHQMAFGELNERRCVKQ